ncbi:unnamed protein product [[Candida] boidinii]|uniref:Unnamed protein product n=1 Tax=Candida boidinii TaxID=5477 RepID=A0A9W6SV89_CANBO|nr:hypothetical protein B5S30_g5617 [[Candida] boidinii]OWB85640.1 hypothetical protein B5S33_g4309 [[Candida] boidinii]GME67821.1 unnamed protein product [[Candida] boidinii]GMF97629.1 unnamed protein product [[Candida] boidinii]
MLKSISAVRQLSAISSKRYATTVAVPQGAKVPETKMLNLLSRLDKFDNNTKIFNKLDDLYLLSQRKGFFNSSSNNLEFLSNNNNISNRINNLKNFNNLNKLITNSITSFPLPLPSSTNSSSSSSITSSSTSALKEMKGLNDKLKNNSFIMNNSSIISSSSMTSPSSFSSPVGPSTSSLNLGNSFSFGVNGGFNINRHNIAEQYLKTMFNLAKNDYELQDRIALILKQFENEDDFFFSYVLEFWLSGKDFNKSKNKKDGYDFPNLKNLDETNAI